MFRTLASVMRLHSPDVHSACSHMMLRGWTSPQAVSAITSPVTIISQQVESTSGQMTWSGVVLSVAHYPIRVLNLLQKKLYSFSVEWCFGKVCGGSAVYCLTALELAPYSDIQYPWHKWELGTFMVTFENLSHNTRCLF